MDSKQAIETLSKALSVDPNYAQGWHDNIAMVCYDAIYDVLGEAADHDTACEIANNAASRFMKLAFHVETTKPSDAT